MSQAPRYQEQRNPFRIRCDACQHVWVIAYLPMPISDFARIGESAHCPMCGNGPKNLFMAKDSPPAQNGAAAVPTVPCGAGDGSKQGVP